jgi:hypothetical protein
MTTRYLVSCEGYCLCDTDTQETITFTKPEADGALKRLHAEGLTDAIIIQINVK